MFKYTPPIQLLLIASKTQAQKALNLTFNETNVELSVEDQRWFNSFEGSAKGPEMVQRLRTLRDIIETIDDSTNMRISPVWIESFGK